MVGFRGKVRIPEVSAVRDLFSNQPNAPTARKARDYLGRYSRKKAKPSPKFLEAFGLAPPEPPFTRGKRKRVYGRF